MYPFLDPCPNSSTNPVFTEFVQKSKMRYLIEGLGEIQINHIDRVAVVYTVSNPIKKLQEVTKRQLPPLLKPCWLAAIRLLLSKCSENVSPVGDLIESYGVRYQQYADDTQL